MTALIGAETATQADLVAAAIEGDLIARDRLIRDNLDAITAVCRRRLGAGPDAEDAIQDTVLDALANLDRLRDPDALRPWLCRIAERRCLRVLRSRSRLVPTPPPLDLVSTDESPDEAALRKERAEYLHTRLQRLDDDKAKALWARDAVGEPIERIAADLGVTEGSARVLLSRARQRLRDSWGSGPALLLPAFLRRWFERAGEVAEGVGATGIAIGASVAALLTVGGLVLQSPPSEPKANPVHAAPATTTHSGATDGGNLDVFLDGAPAARPAVTNSVVDRPQARPAAVQADTTVPPSPQRDADLGVGFVSDGAPEHAQPAAQVEVGDDEKDDRPLVDVETFTGPAGEYLPDDLDQQISPPEL